MKQCFSTRPAFFCINNRLYKRDYTFEFYGGFAIGQKQKCINSFHTAIKEEGNISVLEISRKSDNLLGGLLSAFNLTITINDNKYPVECVYQASKVFDDIQYIECLHMLPADAKRFVKEKSESKGLKLTEFNFFGKKFPLVPNSIFYDYLYIYSLSQNKGVASEIIKYDCFTDIEFNPKKQISSQARSCAIFKYLYLNNLVDDFLSDYGKFNYLYYEL